jgi:hypothetical protein
MNGVYKHWLGLRKGADVLCKSPRLLVPKLDDHQQQLTMRADLHGAPLPAFDSP